MPPSYTDDQIVYAVRDGLIIPAQLDRMAQGMIDLVNKTRAAMSIDNYRVDVDAHDEVAHQAAIESIVMLKNDDAILPLNADPVANPSATPQKIAVIGEFARTPRYQGGGSSHITPTKMTSFLDTLAERGIKADFAPGFTLDLEPADPALESEAVETAKNADVVEPERRGRAVQRLRGLRGPVGQERQGHPRILVARPVRWPGARRCDLRPGQPVRQARPVDSAGHQR